MKQLKELPLECRKSKEDDVTPDGHYQIRHPYIKDYIFWILLTTGSGWEHLSVSIKKIVSKTRNQVREAKRCPTWEEMCLIKDLFWESEECVVQYHPPESHYVNNHRWCLHLWRPTQTPLPIPDALMVGLPGVDAETIKEAIATGKPINVKLNVDEGDE